MHPIRPINTLTISEIRELAHAAAERCEPVDEANPYEPQTAKWQLFKDSYAERDLTPA